jgi:arylsulfatase A-like enzyme
VTSHKRLRAARRGRLFFGLAALAALVVAGWLLTRPGPAPNVLLITIDTMREDALAEAPALLDLARKGTRFVRVRTPVPLTLPAHATILTGLDPPGHGLRDNTAPPLPDREARPFPLLAEEFSGRGYATAAFVASAVLDPRYRLDAGFDEYRHPPVQRAGTPGFAALTAEEQVRRVLDWLETRPRDRPFFVWVHLWEPHAPYEAYAGDERRAGTADGDPTDERYRGEVRRADAGVEALLTRIDLDTTVVLATSDHGESLGEHGEPAHGFLCYGATMDVPCVLAGPGVPAGRTVDRPGALADLAPTLRRLSGLAAQPGDGRDLFDLPENRVVAGESLYGNRLYRWAQQAVAFDGRWSLVDGGPRLELFDRAADPGERRPLPDPDRHARFEGLDRALQEYRARKRFGEPAAALASAPTYYGSNRLAVGDFLRPQENRDLPDVKAMLPADELLGRFRAAIAARSAAVAKGLLARVEALEAQDPANPAPALARGRALLLVLGDPAAAAAAIEEAVRRGYDADDVFRLLARAYGEAGDEEGVARTLRRLDAGKNRPR